MRLDHPLPRWHLRERHRLPTPVAPTDLLLAAEEPTWGEVPLMRALMRVRAFGRLRFDPGRRILDDMQGLGFTTLDRTADELVIGATGWP